MKTKAKQPIWKRRSTYDDYVSKKADGFNAWAYICEDHAKEFNVPDRNLKVNPCSDTICGVKGCNKEAHYYCDMV